MRILDRIGSITESPSPGIRFRWILAACLALAILCLAVPGATPVRAETGETGQEAYDAIVTGLINLEPFQLEKDLNSRTASLKVLQGDESHDLLQYRQSETVYIASLTKIMTGYCAYSLLMESGRELEDKVTVQASDLKGLAELNASVAGFQAGEEVSFMDLFHGLFLSSGCDAAQVLARETAGSPEALVEAMNARARALGLTGTHFANTTGLFHVDNYGTADDLADLIAEARGIDFLRQVMETRHYSSQPTDVHPQGLAMVHSLLLYATEAGLDSRSIDGGKTGQLKEAGYCLASFKELDDCVLVLCTTGAEEAGGHISDHLAIYQAFLEQYPAGEECLITGIGERVPLKPEPPQAPPAGEEVDSPTAPSPAAALTAVSALLLAVLALLLFILLLSALIRRRLEKNASGQ